MIDPSHRVHYASTDGYSDERSHGDSLLRGPRPGGSCGGSVDYGQDGEGMVRRVLTGRIGMGVSLMAWHHFAAFGVFVMDNGENRALHLFLDYISWRCHFILFFWTRFIDGLSPLS